MTMTAYRRLWWTTLLAIGLPAAALSLVEVPVLVLVIGVTLLGAAGGLTLAGEDLSRMRWPELACALALVVASAPVLGRLTVALLLLTAATSPPVVDLLLSGRRPGTAAATSKMSPPQQTAEAPALDAAACLHAMSGAELCELWSQSFTLVKSAADVSHRVVAARLRAGVLDELERRDGARFAAWLRRSPSPASEPRWATGSWTPNDQ